MSTINREAYKKLIDEDIEFLERIPHDSGNSLEKQHIIQVLRWSIGVAHADPQAELAEATRQLREIVKLVTGSVEPDPEIDALAAVEEYVEEAGSISRYSDVAIAEVARLKYRAASYACDRCFAQYGLDAVVPNELWKQLATREDGSEWQILCLWCMDEIAVDKGVRFQDVQLYFPGKALGSALPWQDVCRDGQKDAWIESLKEMVKTGARALAWIAPALENVGEQNRPFEVPREYIRYAWERLAPMIEGEPLTKIIMSKNNTVDVTLTRAEIAMLEKLRASNPEKYGPTVATAAEVVLREVAERLLNNKSPAKPDDKPKTK